MIQTSEDRILTVNGKVIERRTNTLTFRVRGAKFPNFSYVPPANSQGFIFKSSIPQSIQVNWGDGITESVTMSAISGGFFAAGWSQDGLPSAYVPALAVRTNHTYVDGLTADRVITFMFQDLSKITNLVSSYILLESVFPTDILSAAKLNEITITGTLNMTNLPNLINSKDLKILSISQYSANRYSKIPDSFFIPKLTSLRLISAFDLSDLITSNLFKMDQHTDLDTLDLSGCDVTQLDETFRTLTKLKDLRIIGSKFSELPNQVEDLNSLNVLYLTGSTAMSANCELLNMDKLMNVRTLYIGGDFNLTTLPVKWRNAYSLVGFGVFQTMVSQSKFNQFIDVFYQLCTMQGSILPDISPAPYPNRFRNIAWGFSGYSFTGSKVAPTGYVQGGNNGTPINQGQKVYVLQNQYNHTITHA